MRKVGRSPEHVTRVIPSERNALKIIHRGRQAHLSTAILVRDVVGRSRDAPTVPNGSTWHLKSYALSLAACRRHTS